MRARLGPFLGPRGQQLPHCRRRPATYRHCARSKLLSRAVSCLAHGRESLKRRRRTSGWEEGAATCFPSPRPPSTPATCSRAGGKGMREEGRNASKKRDLHARPARLHVTVKCYGPGVLSSERRSIVGSAATLAEDETMNCCFAPGRVGIARRMASDSLAAERC